MKDYGVFEEWNKKQMEQVVKNILAEKDAMSHADPDQSNELQSVPTAPFKQLRKESNLQAAALLFYFFILNAAVFYFIVSASVGFSLDTIQSGNIVDLDYVTDEMMNEIMSSVGRGYLIATIVAVAALVIWKKPRYVSSVIMQKGKPMGLGAFFGLLSLAMAPQLISQVCDLGMQWVFEIFGQDASGLEELGSAQTDTLPMLLYVGIAAPIAEELLFRGVLLRAIARYNRKLAIFASALLFGLFHGNLVQTPYALMVGIVLGYVAMEYHIIWAIILHLFNNLGFAILFPALLSGLPVMVSDWIIWAAMIAFFLAAILVLIAKNEQVRERWKEEKVLPWQRRAVFGAPVLIVLVLICLVNIIMTTEMMFQ